MNKRFLCFFLMTFSRLAAQPPSDVVFVGRIVDGAQKGIKDTRVILIGVGEGRTDDDGMFRISIPSSLTEVQVSLDQYEVIYPRAGRALVPRSQTTPVLIEVKKIRAAETEKLIRQLQDNVRKLENDKRFREDEIRRLEKRMQDSIQAYQRMIDAGGGQSSRMLDSMQQKISRLLASQESTLLKEKKVRIYQDITQTLLVFLDKSRNLRDALTHIDDVFLSVQAQKNFERKVDEYNAARDSLYNKHKGFGEQVRLFWDNPELNARMEAVNELALDQIHVGIILPMNRSVIGPIGDAATGRTSRLSASKKARKGAHKALEQLVFPLNSLGDKINTLSGMLSR